MDLETFKLGSFNVYFKREIFVTNKILAFTYDIFAVMFFYLIFLLLSFYIIVRFSFYSKKRGGQPHPCAVPAKCSTIFCHTLLLLRAVLLV